MGRRGVFYLLKLFLPAVAALRGGQQCSAPYGPLIICFLDRYNDYTYLWGGRGNGPIRRLPNSDNLRKFPSIAASIYRLILYVTCLTLKAIAQTISTVELATGHYRDCTIHTELVK